MTKDVNSEGNKTPKIALTTAILTFFHLNPHLMFIRKFSGCCSKHTSMKIETNFFACDDVEGFWEKFNCTDVFSGAPSNFFKNNYKDLL